MGTLSSLCSAEQAPCVCAAVSSNQASPEKSWHCHWRAPRGLLSVAGHGPLGKLPAGPDQAPNSVGQSRWGRLPRLVRQAGQPWASFLISPIPIHGPLPLQTSNGTLISLLPQISDFLFCHQLAKAPAFKGSCEYMGLS